ncbi:MAG: sugar phosphate isomerase/epimerase [Phycisphaerae bacterium]|nr:sugar phosphate isomerase/epimerase [Phycisphaerae bacterium]
MPRAVTLFTGQWADLPLEVMAEKAKSFGYDGLELACWGDHFDPAKAMRDKRHCQSRWEILQEHGLQCYAISNHLVGQAVCDIIDARHKLILPERVWGDGNKEGVRKRAAAEMITTAKAAAKFGVKVVNGFTGSSVWHKLYFFPPTSPKEIDDGFKDFGKRWIPILDEFAAVGVKFGLEVHPGEIAYDIYTAQRAIDAVNGHPAFGFNFDPSHLLWQGVDPAIFIDTFKDRIWHVHMKDVATNMNGTSSILGSHLAFGDHRRGWDFRSVGRGHVDFDAIIRALNRANYQGPLSVEWEDAGMDREHGAKESCEYVRGVDFTPSAVAFDAAFDKEDKAKK